MLAIDRCKKVGMNKTMCVKIRRIAVLKSSMVLATFWSRHPLNFVMEATEVGLPKSIDERRAIDEVVFRPMADGKIEVNDVLGAINILHAQPQCEYDSLKETVSGF
jgi:hypothetical protein